MNSTLMESRLKECEELLEALGRVDATNAQDLFTNLFTVGCELLELDDDQAARVFDTSRPNVSRWRRGVVAPPAAALILRFMREEVETKVKTLKKLAARRAGGFAGTFAMAAKGR